jgi:hypothetical protein
MKRLQIPNTEYLPPDLVLAEHHPANDKFLRSLEQIERQIVALTLKMKPKHILFVKARHTGANNTDTAKKYRTSGQTVGKAVSSPNALRLLSLLSLYDMSMNGPSSAQRVNMLWEIAQENKELQPKTTINAISELNKMDLTQFEREHGPTNTNPVIQINIDQTTLPKTNLDA